MNDWFKSNLSCRLYNVCMRILYFYNEAWETEYVKEHLPGQECLFVQGSLQHNEALTDAESTVLSIFVNSRVSARELDRFPAAKLIVTRSTGYDHIDLTECAKRGIIVANVPKYGDHTVAEFAMALLLSLSRRVCEAKEGVAHGGNTPEHVRGFDLKGHTIGIVGTGNIGAHMTRIASGFDMTILAFDVRPNETLTSKYGVRYVPFEELLAQSDVISLHAPYNEHTHHMIRMDNYRLIKHGCYLINTARGGLVETKAIVAALEEGILAGAGLDVLEEEGDFLHEERIVLLPDPSEEKLATLLADHYLLRHPRVIVTEHIAYNTQEAVERIVASAIENMASFTRGTPTNVVGA